jgi:hypothetical protein
MKQWEYLVQAFDTLMECSNALDKYGREGWELVSVVHFCVIYMKREKKNGT